MNRWIVGAVVSLVLVCVAGASGERYSHNPKTTEEFRQRDGLPNFFAKIAKAEKTVRIAYLGGSITRAKGWRVKTMAWFKEQYPRATFSEIDAAISGTGSAFAACRLSEDVLRHNPDLVFLECRVNGGGGVEQQSVEGVVRQIWRDNPQTDICFVYTIQINMLESIQAGNNVPFGTVMETIANRYSIPTIDLGVEIANREQAGTLTFKGSAPDAGKILFATDGVHPGDEGHRIYAETIGRCMEAMQHDSGDLKHALGVPLVEGNWEMATLMSIAAARLSAGWIPVDGENDAVYKNDTHRTAGMLRKAVKCDRVGETITVKWTGTAIALTDIPQGEGTVIEAVVDGKHVYTSKRKQTSSSHLFARYWRLPTQPPGEHEVVFTIKQLPEGTSFYVGQFMIVGNPLEKK